MFFFQKKKKLNSVGIDPIWLGQLDKFKDNLDN
jgi:hypothetical protein